MTSPPPPPPRDPDLPDPATDPTLVEPAGRRVVVDEEAGAVVRPYPWWLWVVAGLCLAAAIVFLVLWLMERDDGKDVPKVVGLQLAQAQDRAAADGFTLKTVHTPASQPAGVVVDQAPQPGAELEKGAQVMAVVSAGQEQVTVPHVVGVQLAAGEKLLSDIGLQASNETVQSPKPKGMVIAQDPADGTKVPKGSTVTLRVSSGTGQVKVPAVEGQNLNDAVATVVRAGLTPVVIQVPSQEAKGPVLAQDPPPNEQVQTGSKVRMNVSGGPANTSTQTLTVTSSETTTTTQTETTAITTTP